MIVFNFINSRIFILCLSVLHFAMPSVVYAVPQQEDGISQMLREAHVLRHRLDDPSYLDRAESLLREVLSKDINLRQTSEAYLGLAKIYSRRNDDVTAFGLARSSLEQGDKNDFRTLNWLANHPHLPLTLRERFAGRLAYLSPQGLQSSHQKALNYAQVRTYLRLGNFMGLNLNSHLDWQSRQEVFYQKALRSANQSQDAGLQVESHFVLGKHHMNRHRFDEAHSYFSAALRLATCPRMIQAISSLDEVSKLIGRMLKAQRARS